MILSTDYSYLHRLEKTLIEKKIQSNDYLDFHRLEKTLIEIKIYSTDYSDSHSLDKTKLFCPQITLIYTDWRIKKEVELIRQLTKVWKKIIYMKEKHIK